VAKNRRVKPGDRTRRTARFLERALQALEYEFDTCAEDGRRLVRGPADPTDRNAYLEAALLHARVLSEFLTADETRRRYRDDVLRIDFASPWLPNLSTADRKARLPGGDKDVSAAVRRLDRAVNVANKHLAHLTWARASSARDATTADNIDWLFVEVVRDVATILRGWLAHALDEMPRSPNMDLYSVPDPPSVVERLLQLCDDTLVEFQALLYDHQEPKTGSPTSATYFPGAVVSATTQSTL
jgi:hypothetical protein